MTKVRWGVLGVAKIAVEQVIPAMRACRYAEVRAVASRTLEKAEEAAERLGLERACGSYRKLIEDPEIDAVYNPLPNHLHVPWSVRALEAGKHVLCEKPVALTAHEARRLLEAARRRPRLKTMEAFMYRFHPQWEAVKRLITEGAIGSLRTIHTHFAYCNDDPDNIRNKPEWGGGGLMDIGCYPISLSRWLFGQEPVRVTGTLEIDPRFGVDRLASAVLEFADGTATFTCATRQHDFQQVRFHGTEGSLAIEIPFNPPADRPCWIQHRTDIGTQRLEIPTANHYTLQGDAVSRAIMNQTEVPTPLEDAVSNMAVIDAIRESDRTGRWVRPKTVY